MAFGVGYSILIKDSRYGVYAHEHLDALALVSFVVHADFTRWCRRVPQNAVPVCYRAKRFYKLGVIFVMLGGVLGRIALASGCLGFGWTSDNSLNGSLDDWFCPVFITAPSYHIKCSVNRQDNMIFKRRRDL